MELTFARFVAALRNADVRVSPAETLDAFDVVSRVGVADKALMKDALESLSMPNVDTWVAYEHRWAALLHGSRSETH